MEINKVITTEKLLQIMCVLQTTLDINFLIENFSNELQSIIPHEYLSYKNIDDKINVTIGKEAKNKLVVDINLNKRKLGKLTLSRKDEFGESESEKIEYLTTLLQYPINNILN